MAVALVLIHAISLPPDRFGGEGITQLFTNTLNPDEHPYYAGIHTLRVSAHYLIRRDGALICFVPPALRAWHAGVSCWQGQARCNDFSIGIELEGCDTLPFEPEQYLALAELLERLAEAFPLRGITGHADVAPGRKTDPGPLFSWCHLRSLLEARQPALARCIEPTGGAEAALPVWPFPLGARP